jgi:hypothetical protein
VLSLSNTESNKEMTERNGNGKLFDFKYIGIDGVKLFAALGFVAWATWFATNERYQIKEELIQTIDKHQMWAATELDKRMSEIHERISNLRSTINQQNEVISRINEMLSRVRERQTFVLENIWTKEDHDNWCREVQLKNTNWVCPPYTSDKRTFLFNNLNDSSKEDLNRALTENPNQLWQGDETRHQGSKTTTNGR